MLRPLLLTPSALAPFVLAPAAPAQWLQPTTTGAPTPLAAVAMAADIQGNILVATGDTGAFPPLSDAVWLWTQGTWTAMPTGPGGRYEADMVYDAQRGRWVLYGGWTSLFSVGSGNDETWEFDGATWTQITTAATPGGFWKHEMAYDVTRGVTVLFGGSTSGLPGATDGTYEYDGTNWVQAAPTNTPGWREQHSMCFATALGVTVLFGGFDPLANSVQNSTWTWDGTDWTQVAQVGPQPPARYGAELAYDAARGVCILHGGNGNTGTPFDDTWQFDGTTWTQLPGTGPGDRNFGMAFDAASNLVVRYGGAGHAGETWTFGAVVSQYGAGCAGSNGVPALNASDAPRIGQTYDLTLANLVTSIPAGFVALGLTSTPATPLDAIGMTGCTGHVSLDAIVSGAAAAGTATLGVPLPPNLALIGTSLYAQGISLDPGVNPAWLTVSNALDGVLGN